VLIFCVLLNPLSSDIKVHILLTVLPTLLMELVRGNYLLNTGLKLGGRAVARSPVATKNCPEPLKVKV